jgi:hypothetical protein
MDLLTIFDRDIPWAEISSFLLGLGSVLSGIAAIRLAKAATKEKEDERNSEDSDSNNVRVIDGGGKRISDSDSSK